MGIEINQHQFTEESYRLFAEKLNSNITALASLLSQPDFGRTKDTSLALGAELEMYIIDANGNPLSINEQLLEQANDPQLTLEINQYNLEYNLTPYTIEQKAFASTEQEIILQLGKLQQLAASHAGRVIPIGILPTLSPNYFGPAHLSNRPRYHALVEQLISRRGSQFSININGEQPLKMQMADVTLEGANTSFQIHYRIEPQDFVATFNAVQLVTPLLVALAANSPGLFGHSLWHETRIPLFKQSIDIRSRDRYQWKEPARVNFGHGWARQSALELFQEICQLYSPLLPVCADEDPISVIAAGGIPSLAEMRLHQSTVWSWNRPVYDHHDGGHLRLEMRALPAGPSAVDMIANAAFYIGLAESFKHSIDTIIPALPFRLAEFNFYRAAQFGLNANIVWPQPQQAGCQQIPLLKVLQQCLPLAREGLQSIGVSAAEINKYLEVIEHRINRQQTGASWQQQTLAHYVKTNSNSLSQHKMLEDYIRYSSTNTPVSEWPTHK